MANRTCKLAAQRRARGTSVGGLPFGVKLPPPALPAEQDGVPVAHGADRRSLQRRYYYSENHSARSLWARGYMPLITL